MQRKIKFSWDLGLFKDIFRVIKKHRVTALVLVVIAVIAIPIGYYFYTNNLRATTSATNMDYQLWIQPHLTQINLVRQVLMQPYSLGRAHYGYDSALGLTCGGNIEPSPAIGVSGGYNDACILIDNNLEGSASLDFWNSGSSPLSALPGFFVQNTTIYSTTRRDLGMTFDGIGGCTQPFIQYNYPTSFQVLDRREAEFGFAGPYSSILISPGIHIGGIGSSCGINGQVFYLQNSESPSSTLIVTELPGNQAPSTSSGLETLSFVIDELYMQCVAGTASCSLWQSAYLNAMSQYPFQAPRQALHFIQVTRATQAWSMNNLTFNGLSSRQMLQNTIQMVFTSSSSGGATGPDGGLFQSWNGGSSDKTPEPNFQLLEALDPRLPQEFMVNSPIVLT